MSELDGLTERIAEVLGAHQEQANDDGVIECQCALDARFELPRSMATHQAEQVRAVLGETTTERAERDPISGRIKKAGPDPTQISNPQHVRRYVIRTPWIEAS
jgi:hypothetical protein